MKEKKYPKRFRDKQLVLWLQKEHHKIIKQRALQMDISMTEWVLGAIHDRFEKEKTLGWSD